MRNKILIVLLLLFTGCNTAKLALKKRQWIERKQPNVLAQYCASVAKTDTFFRKGKDSIIQIITIDTFPIITHDSITKDSIVINKVPFPIPSVDTYIIHSVDASGKTILEQKITKQKAIISTEKGKLKTTTHWAIAGWIVALLACIGIGFFVKFPRL